MVSFRRIGVYSSRLCLKDLSSDAVSSPPGDVTRLLLAWSSGDRAALENLIPLVYGELRRIAARYLRHERPGHTLQPTVLVHEAYLKLVDQDHAHWQNRAQFFGVAAQLMRRILVDHARMHVAAKRGGGMTPVTLVDVAVVRFLIACEAEGIGLRHCAPYIREWMGREQGRGE